MSQVHTIRRPIGTEGRESERVDVRSRTFLSELRQHLHLLDLLLALRAVELRKPLFEEVCVYSIPGVLRDAVVVLQIPSPRRTTFSSRAHSEKWTHLASQKTSRKARVHRRSDGILPVERATRTWPHGRRFSDRSTNCGVWTGTLTRTPSPDARGGTCCEERRHI